MSRTWQGHLIYVQDGAVILGAVILNADGTREAKLVHFDKEEEIGKGYATLEEAQRAVEHALPTDPKRTLK